MSYLNVTLIVLAFLGIIDAFYLSWKHIKGEKLICPLNEQCEIVTQSNWAKILGIRNEFLGVAYYVFVFITGIFLAQGKLTGFVVYLAILTGISLLFSVFLVYVQAKIIKNYCFYCLVSAFISFLIFLNAISL